MGGDGTLRQRIEQGLASTEISLSGSANIPEAKTQIAQPYRDLFPEEVRGLSCAIALPITSRSSSLG